MSAFKKLKKSDVIVVPYLANKSWYLPISNSIGFESHSIDFFQGTYTLINTSSIFDSSSFLKTTNGEYKSLIYYGIRQLYYSNFTGSYIEESGSYDNFKQSTLVTLRQITRTVGQDIGVISIPQNIFGNKILPKSFQFSGSFSADPNDNVTTPTASFNIKDDGEGNLYDYVNVPPRLAGNIIYTHGIIILNDATMQNEAYEYSRIGPYFALDYINGVFSFKNEYTVYENEIRCLIREDEFNYSQNVTLLTSSFFSGSNLLTGSGYVKDFVTASFFSPYITTVGLYNEANELLLIGKSSQPIPKSPTTDLNIIIRYDS